MKRLIFIFLFVIAIAQNSNGQTIHGIVFSNSDDRTIGTSCLLDYQNMKEEFKRMKNATGYRLSDEYFIGYNFKKTNLLNKLNNLSVRKGDIIFFYISTHGVRSYDDKSKYPQVQLNNTSYPSESDLLSAEAIHNKLKNNYGHSASLIITMIDACNSYSNISAASTVIGKGTGDCKPCLNSTEVNNYKRFFTQTKGDILVTSSKKGQTSAATDKGSAFTNAYLNTMRSAVSKSYEYSWSSVLSSASKKTYQSFRHNPVYDNNTTQMKGYVPKSNYYSSKVYRGYNISVDKKRRNLSLEQIEKTGRFVVITIKVAGIYSSCINKRTYVKSGSKRYYLDKAENIVTCDGDAGYSTNYEHTDYYKLYFPTFKVTKKFDIIECERDGCYNFYDVDVD